MASSHVVTRVLVLVLAPLLLPSIASAQERARVSERLHHRDRLATVELPATVATTEFTTAATARRATLRAATVRSQANAASIEAAAPRPVPPDPIPPATMVLVAKAMGGGGMGSAAAGRVQSQSPPVLEHIVLNARRPWANERGYLDFVLPFDLQMSVPSVNFNKNFPGQFSINLKVEEGRSYLIDVGVSSWGAGTYRVESDDSTQEFEDAGGSLEHLLVGLNATASGWTRLTIKREGTGYYLYGVEVNRVN